MATSCLTPSPSSSSSSSSPFACKTRIGPHPSSSLLSSLPLRCLKHQSFCVPALSPSSQTFPSSNFTKSKLFTVFALVEDQQLAAPVPAENESYSGKKNTAFNLVRPCELYVCNLPRSFDIAQLLELFKPYGTVQSVEVSRNADTGISRGCGFVTMSSLTEAKAAISALDGSVSLKITLSAYCLTILVLFLCLKNNVLLSKDVDGREMRVNFSVDMRRRGENLEALNSPPKKDLIYESPYKLYVGNLAWSVQPKDLKNLFTQFGTVVSARVLHDRRSGKNRVYGFLSFSSAAELAAALSLHGTDYYGRKLSLREVVDRSQT